MSSPKFIIIAGPNGSGKSTSAPALLPVDVTYVNADEIAKTLDLDTASRKDMEASRLLLEQCDIMADQLVDFAIETTLSSRTLASRIKRLQARGYEFHLLFFWLNTPELAIARVAERVSQGGHNIPEETIRRRYIAGVSNFFTLYTPLADTWRVYDNSLPANPRLIAEGKSGIAERVHEIEIWHQMKEVGSNG